MALAGSNASSIDIATSSTSSSFPSSAFPSSSSGLLALTVLDPLVNFYISAGHFLGCKGVQICTLRECPCGNDGCTARIPSCKKDHHCLKCKAIVFSPAICFAEIEEGAYHGICFKCDIAGNFDQPGGRGRKKRKEPAAMALSANQKATKGAEAPRKTARVTMESVSKKARVTKTSTTEARKEPAKGLRSGR